MSGPLTGAHIHTAARGNDGPVRFNLSDVFVKNANYDLAMGTISLLDAQNKEDLRNNLMYVNVHTDKYPNGEARGQIERNSPCADAPALPSGIASSLREDFAAYPNPSSGKLFIQLGDAAQANYRLIDAMGKTLGSGTIQNGTSLSLEGLNNGIYFLRVDMDGEVQTLKIQKQ